MELCTIVWWWMLKARDDNWTSHRNISRMKFHQAEKLISIKCSKRLTWWWVMANEITFMLSASNAISLQFPAVTIFQWTFSGALQEFIDFRVTRLSKLKLSPQGRFPFISFSTVITIRKVYKNKQQKSP